MRQRRAENEIAAPWQVPVAVDAIAETGEHFDLAANEQARAAVARMAGLRDLPRLEAIFDVTKHGTGGLHVVGRVSATVGQNCVVTLEPLVNEIDESVDLFFEPRVGATTPADETSTSDEPQEMKWDEPEPLLDGMIDLGVLATEFLVLGLDLYPRKPGAVFQLPQDRQSEAGPFAALSRLKKGQDGR